MSQRVASESLVRAERLAPHGIQLAPEPPEESPAPTPAAIALAEAIGDLFAEVLFEEELQAPRR